MPNFTKNAIKQNFIKQLNEKPLSQITVKSIVEECGINRNSFYYHYQDIPALIEEIIRESADGIIAAYPDIDSIETGLNAVISFASRNRRPIMHIYKSVSRDIFEDYLWRVCDYVVDSFMKNVLRGHELSPQDVQIFHEYYKCQCFGMVIRALNQGFDSYSPELVHRFCELQKGTVEELIRRSEEERR